MGWTIEEFDMGEYQAWYIDVSTIDGDLKNIIDQYIVDICFADPYYSVANAKNHIKKYLRSDDENRKKGAIAEFLIHVFLKTKGYKQECLYFNLEERSPKKGFDGVYLDENDVIWYMESKSGTNISYTHKEKIEEAYRDLKTKFLGTTNNDPWRNALNHAKIVGASNNILDEFRRFSIDYENSISHDIEDYNVIPCGTLYIDDSSKTYNSQNIVNGINGYFLKKNQNGLGVICLTQQAVSEFETYLDT